MCKTVLLPGHWSNFLSAQPVGNHIWLWAQHPCLAGTDIDVLKTPSSQGRAASCFAVLMQVLVPS